MVLCIVVVSVVEVNIVVLNIVVLIIVDIVVVFIGAGVSNVESISFIFSRVISSSLSPISFEQISKQSSYLFNGSVV